MEIIKLILVSCTLLVSCSKGDDAPTAIEREDQSEQTTVPSSNSQNYGYFRRFNEVTNSLRQCFCFLQKPTGVPVIHRLNPNGEKLERLIIYAYRDESSNDFKIYLPNYEKQLMIPDLALDQGDILEVWTSDEIQSIFKKYSSLKTNRNSDISSDIAQIIDPETFYVPGSFDDGKIPNDSKKRLTPNNYGISTSEQQIYTYPSGPITPDGDQIKEDDSVYDFSDTTNMNRDPDLLPYNIEYNTEISKPDQEYDVSQDPNEISEDGDLEDKSIKVVQISQNFDLNSKPGNTNEITKDNTVIPNSDNNFNININLDLGNDDEITERPPKLDVRPQPYEHDPNFVPKEEVENPKPVTHEDYVTWPESPNSNFVPMPTNPLIWNTVKPQYIPAHTKIKKIINFVPEQKIVNTIPIQNQKIWHHKIYDPNQKKIVTLHPHKLIQKHPQEKPITEHDINLQETFDNWLIHQLQTVQFAESQVANSIDVYTLKYLIERTLQKSGFYIATNGLLVDSKGVKIHMANLALRPILIGDSVEYKKLMKDKVSTFKLPTDLPYLEAVLITSIKPQKILGIVPLGKTYLPKDYRTPLSLYVQDPSKQTPGGCNICHGNGIQNGQFFQKDFITNPVEKITHQYPSKWITKYSPYLKRQRYQAQKLSPTPTPFAIKEDGQVQGTHRVIPFNQISTFLDKLYKVPLSVNKVKYVGRPYVVDYSVQPVVTKQTYHAVPVVKYPVNVVTPGFRIIGGNAATSSGTPVSSKGRSGLEPEEPEEPKTAVEE